MTRVTAINHQRRNRQRSTQSQRPYRQLQLFLIQWFYLIFLLFIAVIGFRILQNSEYIQPTRKFTFCNWCLASRDCKQNTIFNHFFLTKLTKISTHHDLTIFEHWEFSVLLFVNLDRFSLDIIWLFIFGKTMSCLKQLCMKPLSTIMCQFDAFFAVTEFSSRFCSLYSCSTVLSIFITVMVISIKSVIIARQSFDDFCAITNFTVSFLDCFNCRHYGVRLLIKLKAAAIKIYTWKWRVMNRKGINFNMAIFYFVVFLYHWSRKERRYISVHSTERRH